MAKFLFFLILYGALAASCNGAKLGELCLFDSECQNDTPGQHSTCFWFTIGVGRCECKWTDDASGQTCIQPPATIGDYCELERHCHYSLGHLSRCPNHECTCTDGTSPNEDGTQCVPNLKIGDTCTSHEECPSGGGYGACIVVDRMSQLYKTCVCHCGSVPNENNTECLQFRRLGWSCDLTSQCQIAGCGDLCYCGVTPEGWQKCLCEEGYVDDFWNGNKCVPKRENLGDECSVKGQCTWKMGPMSDCIDGKCDCKENSVPDFENNFCNPINETSTFSSIS